MKSKIKILLLTIGVILLVACMGDKEKEEQKSNSTSIAQVASEPATTEYAPAVVEVIDAGDVVTTDTGEVIGAEEVQEAVVDQPLPTEDNMDMTEKVKDKMDSMGEDIKNSVDAGAEKIKDML